MSDHESQPERDLLESARLSYEPNDAERARMKRGIDAAIAAAAVGAGVAGAASAGQAAASQLGIAKVILGAMLGVSVVTAGVWVAQTVTQAPVATAPDRTALAASPRTSVGEANVVAEPPTAAEPEVVPVPVIAPAPEVASPSREEAPDPLTVEMDLLDAAHTATVRGDHAAALAILEAHARDFPRGEMAFERDVQRVLALCALGRAEDATRRYDALAASHPGATARLAGSCVAR